MKKKIKPRWIITREYLTNYRDDRIGIIHSNLTTKERIDLSNNGKKFESFNEFSKRVCSGFMDDNDVSKKSLMKIVKILFGADVIE